MRMTEREREIENVVFYLFLFFFVLENDFYIFFYTSRDFELFFPFLQPILTDGLLF